MNSIYLYSPYWHKFGGGESYMLNLAIALSKLPHAKVTIVAKYPPISKKQLEAYFALNLSQIEYRGIKKIPSALNSIVGDTDLFIPLSNYKKVETRTKNYVQALQIPYTKITPLTVAFKLVSGRFKDGAKDIFRARLLSHARRNARLVLTNSQFVHDTLLRNFGLESEVLYPPIQDFLIEGIPRRKIILSVGRFFKGLYNDKRYDILTAAFRNLSKDMPAWEYHLVGSTSPDKQTQKLIIDLKTANENFPVFFHTDEPYESLKRLYNEALILWHGAGYGVDEIRHPEMTEHFGMSVAEAMSAQCVPIVVNKGGIREIVIHGENGFLWSTTDELIRYTLQVANLSLAELQRLQENAREEYRNFAVTSFNKQVAELFSQLLVEPHLDT